MEFNYTAQDKNGKRVSAKIEAESLTALITQLKNQGLLPIEVKPARNILLKKGKSSGLSKIKRKKMKVRELAIFTRQLSSVLQAGVLLNEALVTIGSDWHEPYFRKVIADILHDIRSGKSFSPL